jgi:hypothetical protein
MPNETPSFELKVDVHIHVLSYVRTRLECPGERRLQRQIWSK